MRLRFISMLGLAVIAITSAGSQARTEDPLTEARRVVEETAQLQLQRRIDLLTVYTDQMNEAIKKEVSQGATEPEALRTVSGWGNKERVRNAKSFLLEQVHSGGLDLEQIKRRFGVHRSAFLDYFNSDSVYLAIPFQESRYSRLAFNQATVNGRTETVKGLWQFIESTAKAYGLEVTSQGQRAAGSDPDQRYDARKSSQAARRFLTSLEERLGVTENNDDVVLVVCAYHLGPGNLDNVIAHYGNRDFWAWEPVDSLSFGIASYNYPPLVLAAWELLKENGVFE